MSNHTPEPQLRTQLYSINTVAERLEVSRDTVRRLIAHGDLVAIKIGATIRVSAAELDSFVERQPGPATVKRLL